MKLEPKLPRSSMRALDVFEAYRIAQRPLSLTELSQRTRIPASTCHGVMRLLEQEGYLYFLGGREAYPTPRLWHLAEDIRRHDPLVQMLELPLSKLRDDLDETVILGVRRGDEVLYLLVLESRQAIRYSSRAGERKPLHSSSIGKVLLGQLSAEDLETWLTQRSLARVTDNTITTVRGLRADLARAAQRGYYMTQGENVSDVMAIAAPLHLGGTVLGIAVAGPMSRMAAVEAKVARRLMQCVRAIEKKNGA